jgi:hypothetical protein
MKPNATISRLVGLSLLFALWITGRGWCADSTGSSNSSTGTVQVLVAYYSFTTNTEKMAFAVVDGAKRVANVAVKLKKVEEVTKEDLQQSTGSCWDAPLITGTFPER